MLFLDGIVENFGDSWLKEFDPRAKENVVQFSTVSLTLVPVMFPVIRSYCKTDPPVITTADAAS